MPPGPETLRLLGELRVTVDDAVDTETRRLVAAWARGWDEILTEARAAVDDLVSQAVDGWPSRAAVLRAERVGDALRAASAQLDRLAAAAEINVVDAAGQVVQATAQLEPAVIASQFPAGAGTTAALAVRFDLVSADAITAIVGRTAQQVTSLLRPLSASATEVMLRELVRGVAVGDNPRATAARMLRRVEGAFNGGLHRALVIARTEMLDAHRQAAFTAHQLNVDVLQGWVWTAHFDERTCPSCLAQHGGVHPLDEEGPYDHQQGRCARTPLLKTWRDLGFAVDDPPSAIPDRDRWFDEMDAATLRRIFGPARLDGLLRGTLTWDDMTGRRSTDGWRDSYVVPPLRR